MEESKKSISAPAQVQCQPQATKEAAAEEVIKAANESSPYMQYQDVEDYKMKGYGSHGHQPTVDNPRGAGATDAPTLSGTAVSDLRNS